MKKITSSLIIFSLLVITACGNHDLSTSSELYVVEKGYSKDYKNAWIIAYDPNNATIKEKRKIMIEEPMVWNLIEVKKSYFTSYSKNDDNHWILTQINNMGDEDTLR